MYNMIIMMYGFYFTSSSQVYLRSIYINIKSV